jgi:hypothetical protein
MTHSWLKVRDSAALFCKYEKKKISLHFKIIQETFETIKILKIWKTYPPCDSFVDEKVPDKNAC